jgi:hypothetical protein
MTDTVGVSPDGASRSVPSPQPAEQLLGLAPAAGIGGGAAYLLCGATPLRAPAELLDLLQDPWHDCPPETVDDEAGAARPVYRSIYPGLDVPPLPQTDAVADAMFDLSPADDPRRLRSAWINGVKELQVSTG